MSVGNEDGNAFDGLVVIFEGEMVELTIDLGTGNGEALGNSTGFVSYPHKIGDVEINFQRKRFWHLKK
ncbi:unnamed protein product [Lathyrus sativus]|nr:unnamed protein product [Lathyrus sativus]